MSKFVLTLLSKIYFYINSVAQVFPRLHASSLVGGSQEVMLTSTSREIENQVC